MTNKINTGEKIEWINNEENPKICFGLVSIDNLWDIQFLQYGNNFEYTFNEKGIYLYFYYDIKYCENIFGTVIVK